MIKFLLGFTFKSRKSFKNILTQRNEIEHLKLALAAHYKLFKAYTKACVYNPEEKAYTSIICTIGNSDTKVKESLEGLLILANAALTSSEWLHKLASTPPHKSNNVGFIYSVKYSDDDHYLVSTRLNNLIRYTIQESQHLGSYKTFVHFNHDYTGIRSTEHVIRVHESEMLIKLRKL